jgi:hypothetical protein
MNSNRTLALTGQSEVRSSNESTRDSATSSPSAMLCIGILDEAARARSVHCATGREQFGFR